MLYSVYTSPPIFKLPPADLQRARLPEFLSHREMSSAVSLLSLNIQIEVNSRELAKSESDKD